MTSNTRVRLLGELCYLEEIEDGETLTHGAPVGADTSSSINKRPTTPQRYCNHERDFKRQEMSIIHTSKDRQLICNISCPYTFIWLRAGQIGDI